MDPKETAKFDADAGRWWDETRGPFAPLHAMNPARCAFARDVLTRHFTIAHPDAAPEAFRAARAKQNRSDAASAAPLAGLRLLDVGCGGGILCEALARMGADVVGVDASPGAAAAEAHARAALDPRAAAASRLPQRPRRDAPRDGRNLRRGAVVGGDRTRGGPGGVRAVPRGVGETRRRGDFLHHQPHRAQLRARDPYSRRSASRDGSRPARTSTRSF